MRRANRKPRGFVLLLVLALLVVLTVVASLAYSRASDQVVMSGALKRQAIAQDRAVMGLHRGVADVTRTPRPAYLSTLNQNPPCTNPDPLACPDAPGVPPLVVDGPTSADLDQGGGNQYAVHFIRWKPASSPTALAVVRSIGYHGFDPATTPGASRMQSEVVVEVSEGTPNTGGCVGYCGSGL